MAQRRHVILVCDLCESQDLVETHRISIDGHVLDAEACDTCWNRMLAAFGTWAVVGQMPKKKRASIKGAVSWPDTPWRFTAHALERMGKRKVSPSDILRVIDLPDIRRPGEAADEEVWTRGRTKVVVVPNSQVVLTVAYTDESDSTLEGANA